MTICRKAPLLLALCLPAWGCATAPFSIHAQDNDARSLKAALARLPADKAAAPRNGSGHALAFVVLGPEKGAKGDKTLVGYDLTEGRQLFAVAAEVRSRPVVGRGVVAQREGEEWLVLRSSATGQVRAKISLSEGGRVPLLLGVAADEERVYYVTQRADTQTARESRVTAVSPDGQRLWSVTAPGTVGAPAALHGTLALPYRYQDVVLLDGASGVELSRVRQKDEQIGFVRATPQGFFYGVGERGVAQLGESSVSGVKEQIAYLSPQLGEKVRVFFNWDGYRHEQADFSAFDRNRLLWTIEQKGDRPAFKDAQAVLHSYRFLFAVDTAGGPLRWAYAHPRVNLMASEDTGAAVLFAAADGELGAVDPKSGAKSYSQRLTVPSGQQVIGASFDAAGFAPAAAAQAEAPKTLDVLRSIIYDKDSRFISIKSFAVQQLDSFKSKEATSELLNVVTAESVPPPVARAAGDALIGRKDREVSTMLVSALKERQDYLTDRRPRGVGILAQAAAAMGAKEAVPALVEQLRDPNHSPAVLKELVSALVQLGTAEVVRPLREFVLLYRSDPAFNDSADALKAAGEGLLKLGGEAGRRTVYFLTQEPRTISSVSTYYKKLLDESAPRLSSGAAAPKPR